MAQVVQATLKTNQSQNFIFISSKFSIKSVAFLAPLPFFPSWLQIKIFTVYISFQINVFVSFICTYPGVKFLNHMVVIFLYRDSWFEIIYIKCVCVCVYIMQHYLAIKKNEILTFATTLMNLEGIMLNEVWELYVITYMWNKKKRMRKTKQIQRTKTTENIDTENRDSQIQRTK